MNSERRQYKVGIFGESYTLVSDETEEHITEAAKCVDLLVKEIASKMSVVDNQKAAIFVAIQLASDLIHLKKTMIMNEAKESMLAEKIEKLLTSFSS